MGDINSFALQQAEAAAAKLWAFGTAPFPLALANAVIIQNHIDMLVTDTAIDFAIHVRRILDNSGIRTRFTLDAQFRVWVEHRLPRVADLRDALNRIVHATEFEVGFVRLADNPHNFEGGNFGVTYLRTRTDQRQDALIDVFALAWCFFHQILPELHALGRRSAPEPVQ
jgi:hypothetical protein